MLNHLARKPFVLKGCFFIIIRRVAFYLIWKTGPDRLEYLKADGIDWGGGVYMLKKTMIYLSILFILFLPSRLSAGEVYGVTCADGTHHPPGYDCEEHMRNKMGTGTPHKERQVSPAIRQQQLERERELEWERLRQQQLREAEERRKREEARRKQFEKDKQEALNMLKSGAGRRGGKSNAGGALGLKGVSGSDHKLKGIAPARPSLKKPRFSKGTTYSAPVDLRSIDPSKPLTVSPGKVRGKKHSQKGLRTSYVPKPALGSLKEYQYDKKQRTDIILDALRLEKTII